MQSTDELTRRMKTLLECMRSLTTPDEISYAQPTEPTEPTDTITVETNCTGVIQRSNGKQLVRAGWKDNKRSIHVLTTPTEWTGVTETDTYIMNAAQTHPDWKTQLHNPMKKCTNCGKPNAPNFTQCNACEALLPKEKEYGPNVFTGFMYGIRYLIQEKSLKMSIRKQTDAVLVCDDLSLSLSPCHMLALPMNRYIPDWRFLLRCPGFGLKILEELEDSAWECAKTQLEDDTFKTQFFGSHEQQPEKDDLLMGLNSPPSMSQLHVQCILAPMLPHEYHKTIHHTHFTYNRFFPLTYVKAVLALGERVDVTDETPIEDIIEHFRGRVNYTEMHTEFIAQVHARQKLRGVWEEGKFETRIEIKAKAVDSSKQTKEQQPLDPQFKNDTSKLTNYGLSGLSYYAHVKTQTVPSWVDDTGIATDARSHIKEYSTPNDDVRLWAHTQLKDIHMSTKTPQTHLTETILINIALWTDDNELIARSLDVSEQVMHLFQIFWTCSDRNREIGNISMGITYWPKQIHAWNGSFPLIIPVKELLLYQERQTSDTFIQCTDNIVTWIDAQPGGSLDQQVTVEDGVIKVDFRSSGVLILGERADFIDETYGPTTINDEYLERRLPIGTIQIGKSQRRTYLKACMDKLSATAKSQKQTDQFETFERFMNVCTQILTANNTRCTFILEYGIPVRCASRIDHTGPLVKWRQDKFPTYVKTSRHWGKPDNLHRLSTCESVTHLNNAVKNMQAEDQALPYPFQAMEWAKTGRNTEGEYHGVVITLQGVRTDDVHHIWSSSETRTTTDEPFTKEANVASLTWTIEELATNPAAAQRLVAVIISLGGR